VLFDAQKRRLISFVFFALGNQAGVIISQKKNDPFEMDPTLEGACFVGDPTEPLPGSDWPEELKGKI
jgi:hypothetical protein